MGIVKAQLKQIQETLDAVLANQGGTSNKQVMECNVAFKLPLCSVQDLETLSEQISTACTRQSLVCYI